MEENEGGEITKNGPNGNRKCFKVREIKYERLCNHIGFWIVDLNVKKSIILISKHILTCTSETSVKRLVALRFRSRLQEC